MKYIFYKSLYANKRTDTNYTNYSHYSEYGINFNFLQYSI